MQTLSGLRLLESWENSELQKAAYVACTWEEDQCKITSRGKCLCLDLLKILFVQLIFYSFLYHYLDSRFSVLSVSEIMQELQVYMTGIGNGELDRS